VNRGAAQQPGKAAAASLDGGAAGQAAGLGQGGGLTRPGGVGPAALPGFGSLPGLGGDNGGFRLPGQVGGQGTGQQAPPPAFRGRPGKKGR
jgi:hypothetical protein